MTVDSPHDRRFQFPTPPPDSDSYKHSGHTSPTVHRSRASSRTRNDVAPPPELSEQRRTPRLAAGWRPEAETELGDEDRSNGKESPASARALSSEELVELLGASPTFVPPSEAMQLETPGRQRAVTTSDSVQTSTPTILEAPMSRTMSTPPGAARRRESSRVLKSPLEIVQDGADDRHPIVHQTLEFPRRMPSAGSSGLNGTEVMGEMVDEMTPPRKPRLRQSNPTSATLPPLPFHSYLSLTLGSPTSITPNRSSPLAREGAESTTQVYGAPPHHPDDSGAIALERILNFLMLPPKLEGALMFGLFACLDSWLYIFTILPLRFLKALGVLIGYWNNCIIEYFTYDGKKLQKTRRKSIAASSDKTDGPSAKSKRKKDTKLASDLMPSHKADIMRGMVLFTTCWVLMRFDASKMYHSVRGQSGIKLYVIYNMLDFGDRLCAAVGQDIFECLFSREILDRRPDGRSKIWRPFGIFLLALCYNILHSLVLFYQVITLNVAVNSYSNALVTLLLSVQFVEIKATVFKRFDKENLFQLTCADIVERFQLLLMLIIIWTRNLVEMGVWSLSSSGPASGVLPKSFTFFPTWTGRLMGPFFMVLGSEMFVDWLKHAYITKFNNMRPVLYERFLDVQCKDYYTHAFTDQNLTKRLGLPVLPLASVFIRSTIQTYHMFLATHVPSQLPSTTSLTESHLDTSETSAALASIDNILRRALSNSALGESTTTWTDDIIATSTTFFFLTACFLVFLAVKLVLGVTLLRFARNRYRDIRERDRMWAHTGGKPGGAFGVVQVSEDQRTRIYEGDPKGEKSGAERNRRARESEMNTEMEGLEKAQRYSMVSKRIW